MFDTYGQLLRATNPNTNVTLYEYFSTSPSEGYLKQVTVAPGQLDLKAKFETDARGNVTAAVDPRGVLHEWEYNELDWLVYSTAAASASTVSALGYKSEYHYDANGNLAKESIPFAGIGTAPLATTEVKSEYGLLDELLKVERQVDPGGVVWSTDDHVYDENFNLIRETDPVGNVREIE